MNRKVLVVDNEEKMCLVIKMALEMENFQVEYSTSALQALSNFDLKDFPVIISDLKMAPLDGLTFLKEVKKISPQTEFILMTAYASQETAVEAMKEGAADYLIKPFEMDELIIRLNRLFRQKELMEENLRLKNQEQLPVFYSSVVGKSHTMQKVYQLIEKIKDTDATILIRGESGTGKEVIARAIHDYSIRAREPFVSVNCAAVPSNLLESELFGYEKGAFTGADRRKPGKFEIAGAGTVFLDEIGELSPETQAKLLRVLEDKSFYHLGGLELIQLKARIIAATNRNLEEMVANKAFREDLYYRLSLFPIHLPPLRERKEDIPDLVWYFLKKMGEKSIDKNAMRILMEYDWPGNVRQLQNVLYRASIIAGDIITAKDLPSEIVNGEKITAGLSQTDDLLKTIPSGFQLDEFEKKLILKALDQAGGNKSHAAKLLGITRRRLYSLMEKHQIPLHSDD